MKHVLKSRVQVAAAVVVVDSVVAAAAPEAARVESAIAGNRSLRCSE
jgi:hypothetical protein